MESFFSPEVLAGIKQAKRKAAIKKNRLRVHVDDAVYPVTKLWENGFSLVSEAAPNLRGFVDLYDGSKHLLQCLVIHSEPEGDVMNYEFKRSTVALDKAPKDFAVDDNAPIALIGR